jgi:hypothetical protein
MHLFFRALSQASRILRVALAITIGFVATFAAPSSSAAAPTTGPASVTITPAANGAGAVVSWTPVSEPVDLYVVDVYVNGTKTKSAQCGSYCTSRTVRYLTPGQSVRATVAVRQAGVTGPAVSSPTIVIGNPCATATVQCIRIDGSSNSGPVTGVAQGFLHSNAPSLDQARASVLRPQSWRVRAANGSFGSFDAARALGTEVLLLVGDHITLPSPDPAASGSLTQAIDTYRAGLRTYVQSLITTNRLPDLWEIQNEPDLMGWSKQTQLAQWKAGYQEIKALVPNAKIMAPASSTFMGTPADATPNGVDLQTFLAFAAAEGLRPAAIGWHENRVATAVDFETQPEVVVEHVAWARQLLAANGLSGVEIRIDEYGGREDNPIPGWQVGWFNALETAGVDAAEHSCFPFPDGLVEVNGCETPNLNTLLSPSSQSPRANYWVAMAYGRMTGRRLATASSTDTLSTLATASTTGTISALVGRHVGCVPVANPLCPMGSYKPAATDVAMSVAVPSSTAALRVVIERVPFSSGGVAGPTMVSDTVKAASAGAVSFTLPQVADGDALILTLTPSAAPAPTTSTTTTTTPTVTTTTTTTTSPLTSVVQAVVKGLKLF